MTDIDTTDQGVEAVLERLDISATPSKYSTGDPLCAEAASLIRQMQHERDEALDRVDELENEREETVKSFESDCWNALRSLLDECGFDWRDALDGGVTAEEAREHISTTLAEMNDSDTRHRRRVMDVEDENEKLRGQLANEEERSRELARLALNVDDERGLGLPLMEAVDHISSAKADNARLGAQLAEATTALHAAVTAMSIARALTDEYDFTDAIDTIRDFLNRQKEGESDE